ncbi:MAG: cytochrome c oxidase subunit 2A [Heyndrickxia sp.]
MSYKHTKSEVKLKGTLVSVFIVGIAILAMWFSVYCLYLTR